jgi:NADP-dependent 3-hydroxy acid dehydrogenase YdfG
MSKVVLITGGSSGIGKAIGVFTSQGFVVYGTSRNPEQVLNSIFPLVTLDVRNSESIQGCCKKNHRKLRQIRYCYQ